MIKINNKNINKKKIPQYIFIFSFMMIIFLPLYGLFQYHVNIFNYMGFGGLFINDTLSMQSSIASVLQGANIAYRTILGVFLLYSPSYFLGNIYCYFVNVLLFSYSIFFYFKSIYFLNLNVSIRKLFYITITVLTNFYVLGVFFHPNKEIPLFFLTNMFIYFSIVKKKTFPALIIIFFTFLVRDAFGFILVISFFLIKNNLVQKIIMRNPYRFLILCIIVLASFDMSKIAGLEFLGELNYVLQRNLDYGSTQDSILSNYPHSIQFFLKLLNNFVSSAIRPQLIDKNLRLYIAGIGLWQFGIVIFLGISSWFIKIKKFKKDRDIISIIIIIFICLFSISFGSFTQPRYLMPYIFWLVTGIFLEFDLKMIILLILSIFVIAIIFFFLGLGVSLPQGIDYYPGLSL